MVCQKSSEPYYSLVWSNGELVTLKEREEIMSFFYDHVRWLIRHTEAASLLELAYNDYANAHQREALTREFYGVIVSFNCGVEIINDTVTFRLLVMKNKVK